MASNFEVTGDDYDTTFKLSGAIELHRLTLEDPAQLKRRGEEITAAIINSTCSSADGKHKEVRQAPLPNSSPGDATVPCLPVQSLVLSAAAAEQGR